MTPEPVEMLNVVGYMPCPACREDDAAVWKCADGTHVADCQNCGWGGTVTKR